MVSSRISFLTKTSRHMLLPMGPPDTIPSDQEEFDFSDVFGPAPSQTLIDVDLLSTDNSVPQSTSDSKFHVAPLIIHNRSHSLVGPSPRITQFSQLAKLTIHETESSLEIVECSLDEIELHHEKLSIGGPEKNDIAVEELSSVRLEDFEVLKVVGQGAFGKVFQVKRKGTSEIFAMKVMRKDKIMEKNHAEYMKAERDILTKVNHPFIVQLRYSFQTKYRLYLVLEFVNGGHLFFQLYHQGLFREDLACIYTAEIVSAVSHLHANGIMHRDLKPENILLDADGHVMLTDFGLAKEFNENTRSNSMCGTVEYMAPEIILGKGHDKAADWWSVGILVFEMLTGKPPFVGGNNRGRIQQRIVKEKIKLPAFLTSEAHSLLKGLLQKEADKRLGCGLGGSEEIKRHRWFRSINWKKLDAREVQPGFRPNVAGKLCIANFDERWTSMSVLDSPIASPVAGDCDFAGFTYARSPALVQMPSPLQPKSSSKST